MECHTCGRPARHIVLVYEGSTVVARHRVCEADVESFVRDLSSNQPTTKIRVTGVFLLPDGGVYY